MKKPNTNNLLLISIFGGLFGLDKFYQKKYILGFLKLFTIGGYGIWWIVDIYLIHRSQKEGLDINIPKGIKKVLKPILYIIGILGGLFVLLIIYFTIESAIIQPINSKTPLEKNIDKVKINEIKKELELYIKKKIYYIYWQSEHIASGLTFKKYKDGGKQEERDEYFKNTKLEYEKKLAKEKNIDYNIYKNNSIEIGWGEGEKEHWNKPNSNSDNVLIYVYGKEKFNLFKATNNFLNKKGDFHKKYSSCIGLASMNYNGTVGPYQYSKIIKINNTHININTYVKGKNTFGQTIKENITCMYEYNKKTKTYGIIGIK